MLFFFSFSELPKSNGLLIIEANGGLNQQRLSVGFFVTCKVVYWNFVFMVNHGDTVSLGFNHCSNVVSNK